MVTMSVETYGHMNKAGDDVVDKLANLASENRVCGSAAFKRVFLTDLSFALITRNHALFVKFHESTLSTNSKYFVEGSTSPDWLL